MEIGVRVPSGTASEPLIAFTTSEKGDVLDEMRQSLFVGSSSTDPTCILQGASNRPSGTLFGKMTCFNPFASVPRRISSCGGELRPITRSRRDRVHHRRGP